MQRADQLWHNNQETCLFFCRGTRNDDLDPFDKLVGSRLRIRRLELGWSQEFLATKLGVSFQQVQKYERGVNRVAASRMHQLLGILGVEAGYFFDVSGVSPACVDDDASGLLETMMKKDAVQLSQAFQRIRSPSLRRAILNLIENVAAGSGLP